RVIHPVLPVAYHLEGGSVGAMAEGVLAQIQKVHKELQIEAENYLEHVAQGLRAQSLQVRTCVLAAEHPALAILDQAGSGSFGLIALETHGRRGLSRLWRGSVAD